MYDYAYKNLSAFARSHVLTPKRPTFCSVFENDFRPRALNIRRPGRAFPTKPGPWLMLGARARQICSLEQHAQSLVAAVSDR